MEQEYQLNIKNNKIEFINNTDEFVEVVFAINNKEIREGKTYSNTLRGYCYPPKYKKEIKSMKNGDSLLFSSNSIIRAYIFKGKGKNKEIDYSVPAFIRRKIAKKTALFSRSSNKPSKILEIQKSF